MQKIGIGYEFYKNFIDEKLYYVDKTMLIKDLVESGGRDPFDDGAVSGDLSHAQVRKATEFRELPEVQLSPGTGGHHRLPSDQQGEHLHRLESPGHQLHARKGVFRGVRLHPAGDGGYA